MWIIVGGIYIGSVIASRVILGLVVKAEKEKMKNEGYIDLSPPQGKYEKILEEIQIDVMLLFPIVNILTACMSIFKFDAFYKEQIENNLKEGNIRKMTPEEMEEIKKEEPKAPSLCTTQNIPTNTTKPYSEMTNEEKLRFLRNVSQILQKEQKTIEKEEKLREGHVAYIKK